MKTMRLIGLLLAIIALASCSDRYICKMAAKKCPPTIKDSISYRETITYRDTVIKVYLPSDTVIDSFPVPVDRFVDMAPVHKKEGMISVDYWVKRGNVYFKAYINDSTVFVNLENAIKEINSLKVQITTIQPQTIEVIKIPTVYKFSLWWFIGTLAGLIILLVIKLK